MGAYIVQQEVVSLAVLVDLSAEATLVCVVAL